MFDPIATLWITLWTSISSWGAYLHLKGDNNVASIFYVYGKSLSLIKKEGLFWQLFLVPKKYFSHFYLVALLAYLSSFAIIFTYYVQPTQVSYLDEVNAKIQIANSLTSVTSLMFTLILMVIQSSRRLYESLFVSVFAYDSKMNIFHYVYGHIFYLATALSTVCPILLSKTASKYTFTTLIDNLVTRRRAISFVLFIYASHNQHKCHKILANLRKDKTGRVISQQHYVPSGGLFEYVTCPHFLTEVIIYFIIIFAQEFSSSYWNLIFLLVISSQIINALTEHKWYKRKYSDYPKERKAIFPGLL